MLAEALNLGLSEQNRLKGGGEEEVGCSRHNTAEPTLYIIITNQTAVLVERYKLGLKSSMKRNHLQDFNTVDLHTQHTYITDIHNMHT